MNWLVTFFKALSKIWDYAKEKCIHMKCIECLVNLTIHRWWWTVTHQTRLQAGHLGNEQCLGCQYQTSVWKQCTFSNSVESEINKWNSKLITKISHRNMDFLNFITKAVFFFITLRIDSSRFQEAFNQSR